MFKKLSNSLFTIALALSFSILMNTHSIANEKKQYVCDAIGDGNYIVILSGENLKNAYAVYSLDGDFEAVESSQDKIVFEAKFSGNEFNYINKDIQFVGIGAAGLLIDMGSQSVVPCREEGAQSSTRALNLAGFSLGGKVRSGPGLNFPQTGSVRTKEAITLLENTGITMDGYDWFKIQRPNGEIGFQWGGILCSDDKSIKGIFEQCL